MVVHCLLCPVDKLTAYGQRNVHTKIAINAHQTATSTSTPEGVSAADARENRPRLHVCSLY